MQSETRGYVNWFRNSSPYINAHRNKTFVVAFPGEAVSHGHFYNLIQDLVLLHSLGIKLVVVHGARPQIDQRLQSSGQTTDIQHHRRVSTLDTLPAIIEAIGHTGVAIQSSLVQSMSAAHLSGTKAMVATGNFVLAKPYGIHHGVDYHYSGEVRKILVENIRYQLDGGAMVLLSPLGYSPTGEVFNLLWEEVAEEVAIALNADKVIYLGSDEGINDQTGALIKELTSAQASELIQQFSTPHFTLISAHRAVRHGVNRAHIISFLEDGNLLQELFTVDGTGTLITQDTYEKVRLANIDDVANLLELIEPMEQQGILVRRSRELLETEINHFTIIERDEKIIACAALYPFSDEHFGELACVTVHPNYRHGQRGDTLLKAIEQRANMLGLTKLFVLTTRTAHWFLERGFKASTVAELPEHKKSLYNYQRNSSVFVKTLSK